MKKPLPACGELALNHTVQGLAESAELHIAAEWFVKDCQLLLAWISDGAERKGL